MELDPELISVGPGSRMDRNNMFSRRDKQQSRKVFLSLVPKKINSEFHLICPYIHDLADELHPICTSQGHLFIPM